MNEYKGPEPEFQAFLDRVTHESAAFCTKYTVPFFDELLGDQAQGGTGVLVRIEDSHFIVSAAHVLDVHSSDKSPLYVMSQERGSRLVSLHGANLFASPMPKSGNRLDDPMDVGFLELTPDIVSELGPSMKFLELDQIDVFDKGKSQSLYLTLGCPFEFNPPDWATRKHTLTHFACLSPLYAGERGEPGTFRKNFDLLVHYDPNDSVEPGKPELTKLPDPGGISGCGMWRVAEPEQDIESWSISDIRLIGIQHSWLTDIDCLRGVHAFHPMQMLVASIPGLGDAFRKRGWVT